MPPSRVAQVIPQFPHCDSRVLHGPDQGCQYCDRHPDWQQLRDMWGINFTGENDENKIPCPSTRRRPLSAVHAWPGNRPVPEGTKPPSLFEGLDDLDDEPAEPVPKTVYDRLRKRDIG